MKVLTYDKSLARVETPQGTMTLGKVFLPFFIEFLLLNMVSTINTIMLSSYSDNAVAAVGAASQIINMILTFYTVVSNGASIVINHNLGAGNKKAASSAAYTSIILCTALSLTVGIIMSIFANSILDLMHLEPEVKVQAVTYFRIVISFSFLTSLTSCCSSILRSYGKPKVAVIVSLIRNILIAFFDYIVIFRPIDVPVYGAEGIAYSTVIGNAIATIIIIVLIVKADLGLDFMKKKLSDMKIITTILKVGIPSGVSSISYNLSQVVSTSIIAILGTAAISAKIYVGNIVFYVYVLGMSLGISTSLLIGWLVGAGKYEQAFRLNIQNLKITIIVNIILSTCIYFVAEPLLMLFTSDPQIIQIGKTLMLIDIFVEIGRGFNHIEENSLKGSGDVFYTMMVAIISCWSMSILFSYVLGIKLGLGLAGCWIAFAMDEFFRGTAYFIRWKSRKWMTKTVRSN